jgi:hypothetical protein
MKTPRYALPALLALPVFLLGAPAMAQEQSTGMEDSRWLAWMGCWEATDAGDEEDPLLVCFDALPDGAGVEIRTLAGGEVLAVEEIVADGHPTPAEDGGCMGERTAHWSQDDARIFLGSELHCGEGVTRTTSGIMALARDGTEWLEIHAVQSGDREPILGVRRFAPASPRTLEAQGVEPTTRNQDLAIRTARSVKAAPLELNDVVEMVAKAGAPVARALIAEMGEPFPLTADAARELNRQGVPSDVLDVMVAVTYPERFEIAGASWEAQEYTPQVDQQARAVAPWGATRTIRPVYSPWSPFPMGYYSRGTYFYGSSYWDPYWGGYGSWGPGRIVVVQPEVRDRRSSVNPNTGYTRPGSSPRTATPRSGQAGSQTPQSRPSTTRTPRGSQPSASSRPTRTQATPQGARSSGSSDDRRRAQPRNRGSGGGGGDG